jgi:putative toxin-antitoxin system antitoxin component (TIGR02293 family)
MKKKPVKYPVREVAVSIAEEPMAAYYPYNFIDSSRNGITKAFFMKLAEKLNYTLKEIAHVLNISERTLNRYENSDKLSKDASERALHFVRLYKKGTAVFGSETAFNQWMKTPSLIFNNKTPMSYLDTTFGFEMLEDELGRIEYGIFA